MSYCLLLRIFCLMICSFFRYFSGVVSVYFLKTRCILWKSKSQLNPDQREIKEFSILGKTAAEKGCGGIICMCEEVIPIDDKNCFIPCNLLQNGRPALKNVH